MAISYRQAKTKQDSSSFNPSNRGGGLYFLSIFESPGFIVAMGFISASLLALTINNQILYWLSLSSILLVSVFMKKSMLFLFTLASWAYLPLGYISINSTQSYLNPSSWLLLVLLIRCRAKLNSVSFYLVTLACIVLSAWSFLSVNPSRSAAWVFQFLLLIYFASTAEEIAKSMDYRKVFRGLAFICLSLSALAVLEFVTRSSLLYNGRLLPDFYDSWKWQYYAVFRITTTLGHPLNNGLFFAVAALVFIRQSLLGQGKLLFIGSAMTCSLIVILSASRTAILSLILGALLLLVLEWKKINLTARMWLLFVSPVLLLVVALSPFFQSVLSRFESSEGISSQTYRQDLLQWVDFFSRTFFYTGSGPGTSGVMWASYGNTSPLENGILQMWVSIGLLPTLVIIAISLVFFLRKYWKSGSSMLCFTPIVSYIPFTNFIDSSSSYMPLCALAFVLCNVKPNYEEVR